MSDGSSFPCMQERTHQEFNTEGCTSILHVSVSVSPVFQHFSYNVFFSGKISIGWNKIVRGSQRDVANLGWPIAPSYMSPNTEIRGGGGGVRGLRQWVQLCTWSPKKLRRSNSVLTFLHKFRYPLGWIEILELEPSCMFWWPRICKMVPYLKPVPPPHKCSYP